MSEIKGFDAANVFNSFSLGEIMAILARNDAKLFVYAEDIEKTVKSLRYHKQELKNAASSFFKQYHADCIAFEQAKYFKDLEFFNSMAGNYNWRLYV